MPRNFLDSKYYAYATDEIYSLARVLFKALPVTVREKVFLTRLYGVQSLAELVKPAPTEDAFLANYEAIKKEHVEFFNSQKRFGERKLQASQLQLLIIPLFIYSGPIVDEKSGNHYTCLFIDLINRRYYYQDSLGTAELYHPYYPSCQEIHRIMTAFFNNEAACVDKQCYQQQHDAHDGQDCGPAVLDNIFAILIAFMLQKPIITWPNIIKNRYLANNFSNYNEHYKNVRVNHSQWYSVEADRQLPELSAIFANPYEMDLFPRRSAAAFVAVPPVTQQIALTLTPSMPAPSANAFPTTSTERAVPVVYSEETIIQFIAILSNVLPAELNLKIYISAPMSLADLEAAADITTFCTFDRHRRVSSGAGYTPHLQLLIIPLVWYANDRPYFTCLFINLKNNLYYYQDAMGFESSPEVIRQRISQALQKFVVPHPEAKRVILTCVNNNCFQQTENQHHSGAITLDNIFAILQAFSLGWPIQLWPRIISERRFSKAAPDAKQYYRMLYEQHTSWQSSQASPQLLLPARIGFFEQWQVLEMALQAPQYNMVDYCINLITAFNAIMGCPYNLTAARVHLVNAQDKPHALLDYTEKCFGQIINTLWRINAYTAQGHSAIIAPLYEKYMSNIKALDSTCVIA